MMEKKGVGRPRDGNPEETRRGILRAAETSFASSGFVAATTRHVAAAAGVNVATLHYHFGSKEGLYQAVLEEVVRGALPEPPADGTSASRLARYVEALFDYTAARPTLPRLSILNRLTRLPKGANGVPADPRVAALETLLSVLPEAAPGARLSAGWIVGLIDLTLALGFPSPGEAAPGGPAARLDGLEARRDAVRTASLSVVGLAPPATDAAPPAERAR